jgi:hypothetical protein
MLHLTEEVPSQNSFCMTIDLAADVEEFVREQISAEPSSDANELVNDLLRSLRQLQQKRFQITDEMEAWLLEAADSPVTPLTSGDFEALRTRVRVRKSASTRWR